MKDLLKQLYLHQYLSREQARMALIRIAQEQCSHVEAAAFLSVYNMRNIALEELKGFRDGMLELCYKVDIPFCQTMDVCGTGGDGKNTFNISTLSAFVIAATGIPVAKHGNYGISSISGSSNVMEYLGVLFPKDETGLRRQLDTAGICFIHAPDFHPGMKAIAPVRKQLGMKTFFNMLGPLCNPAQPAYQLVGLYNLDLMRLYQYIFQDEGKQFCLLHSISGYDEVSLTSDVRCVNNQGEKYYSRQEISPFEINEADIYGGETVADAARIFLSILEGAGTPAQNEVVIINSAMAIQTYYPELSLEEAKQKSADALYNREALAKFNQLKNIL